MDLTLGITIIAILISLSAFFGGIEVAFFSVTDAQVKQFFDENRKGSRALKRLREDPNHMLTTVMLSNNLVNIAAAAISTELAITRFGSAGVGIATGIMTIVILIFGEITPKAYCNAHAPRISLACARPIELIGQALYPIVLFFEKITKNILKLLKSDIRRPSITSQEFEAVLELGVKEKVLEENEKQFMEGVLKLDKTSVRSIMTPRTKMFTLDSEVKVSEAVKIVMKISYSRIPVIEKSKDKILGIVHLRDLLRGLVDEKLQNRKSLTLRDISRKPIFVSQEKIISELLKELQTKREHMVIVIDEFGGVEGIVTFEDIIEEAFGEIMDEFDVTPDWIHEINDESALVHGETDIDLINQVLKLNLKADEDYSTISGLLHDLLQDIPKRGDRINLKDSTLIVQKMKGNEVIRVKIMKLSH